MTTQEPHLMVRLREAGLLQFAHRGGALQFPENTLLAFQSALEIGANCIETDVHLTKDGHLVLVHDKEVDRTTDGAGAVRDHDIRQLKALDAGYRFSDAQDAHVYRGQGLTIPTFSELAELPGEFLINVDMKSPEPELGDKLLEAIVSHRLESRIIVASEEHERLASFRRLVKDRLGDAGAIRTSASRREAYQALAFSALRLPWPVPYSALQLPPASGSFSVVTPRLIGWAHRLGVQVHVWTIDETEEMERLARLGVDGVMTDRPEVLSNCLRDRKAHSQERSHS